MVLASTGAHRCFFFWADHTYKAVPLAAECPESSTRLQVARRSSCCANSAQLGFGVARFAGTLDEMHGIHEKAIHYSADDACVASLGPFILFRCFGDVRADAVNASLAAHKVALVARPEGVVSIVLIDSTTKFPSEEMRRAGVAVRKLTNGNVVGSVTIVAGDGFWASTVRGALTAINLLSGSAYASKVFRDAPEGVRWGVEQTGAVSPARVKLVLDALETMAARAASSS